MEALVVFLVIMGFSLLLIVAGFLAQWRTSKQQDRAAQQMRMHEDLLHRQEDLVSRWEAILSRVEALADRWEGRSGSDLNSGSEQIRK